jgi:hypothetical protein
MMASLRRHYPDQVLGVALVKRLSASRLPRLCDERRGLHNEQARESKDEYPPAAARLKGMRKLLLLLTLIGGCAPVVYAPRPRYYRPRVWVPAPPRPVVVVRAPVVRVW